MVFRAPVDIRFWFSLEIAALSREGLPTRGAKRPVTQKATVFLYLLRKNERDLNISKFEGFLGQISKVFSAFPGVLNQPTAHLSTLINTSGSKPAVHRMGLDTKAFPMLSRI